MRRMLLALAGVLALPAPASAAMVWAVGDGAVAGRTDERVAGRIAREGLDRLLYLGDVYERGTRREFANRYHPSFGRFKRRTSPTPGNHEWRNRRRGYDRYWGRLAPRTRGGHWYSFDLGGWHFVSLSSEEPHRAGSRQLAWLRRDLVRRPGTCTIAFLHRPRYSASLHGDHPSLEAVWSALAGRAVAVLSGHDHAYQRFMRDRGLVQFVVGTGGRGLYDVNELDPRLVASSDSRFGALKMRLRPGRARFAFVTSAGRRLDRGSLGCRPHPSPGGVSMLRP